MFSQPIFKDSVCLSSQQKNDKCSVCLSLHVKTGSNSTVSNNRMLYRFYNIMLLYLSTHLSVCSDLNNILKCIFSYEQYLKYVHMKWHFMHVPDIICYNIN